jgi:hypothetical protein
VWLRKHKGGSTVGPHEWKADGDVTEVPDHLGEDLLRIDPRGYEQVPEPPQPAPKAARADSGTVAPKAAPAAAASK